AGIVVGGAGDKPRPEPLPCLEARAPPTPSARGSRLGRAAHRGAIGKEYDDPMTSGRESAVPNMGRRLPRGKPRGRPQLRTKSGMKLRRRRDHLKCARSEFHELSPEPIQPAQSPMYGDEVLVLERTLHQRGHV